MVGNRVDNAQTYAYTPPTPVVGLVDDDDAASQDQEEPIAWNKLGIYITKIVGLQYYAGKVGKGENVILVRDARNKYDANAIKAVNIHNTQIGHIPRMVAGVMAPLLDASKIRLEGICPTGTQHSTYNTSLRLEVISQPQDDQHVREHLKRHGIHLLDDTKKPPPPKSSKAPKLVDLVAEGRSASSIRQQMEGLATALFQVKDMSQLPMHPSPPSADKLTVRLLPHQLQGLRWMIEAEHPSFPAPSAPGKSKEHAQFWQVHVVGNKHEYHHLATNSQQTEAPRLMRGGILADDMGLGKTVQAIALILSPPDGSPLFTPTQPVDSSVAKGTLIVVPLSVVGNWTQQLEAHVAEGVLKVCVYHGPERTKFKQKDLLECDVVISTYGTLAAEWNDKGKRQSPPFTIPWRRVILDEGHVIKNPNARTSKAMHALQAERRWILTGTPITNKVDDLYSMVRFLSYKPFDSAEWYNRIFKRPLAQGDETAFGLLKMLMQSMCIRRTKSMQVDGRPLLDLPTCTVYLQRIPFSFPREEECYRKAEAWSKQELRKMARTGGINKQYANILVLLMRLRQLCNHMDLCPQEFLDGILSGNEDVVAQILIDYDNPTVQALVAALRTAVQDATECVICMEPLEVPDEARITPCRHIFCKECIERAIQVNPHCPFCRGRLAVDALVHLPPLSDEAPVVPTSTLPMSSKVQELVKLLHAIQQGSKSIVFSQWTAMLDRIEPHLTQEGFTFLRLDGTMNRKKRDAAMRTFSAPDSDVRVMLISLKCGSLGLNLTAANHVFLMDPWWNSAIENQAIDRVYRIGQTKPVKVFQLVIQDTIEDRVLDIQARKRHVVNTTFSGITQSGKSTTEEGRRSERLNDLRYMFGLENDPNAQNP